MILCLILFKDINNQMMINKKEKNYFMIYNYMV